MKHHRQTVTISSQELTGCCHTPFPVFILLLLRCWRLAARHSPEERSMRRSQCPPVDRVELSAEGGEQAGSTRPSNTMGAGYPPAGRPSLHSSRTRKSSSPPRALDLVPRRWTGSCTHSTMCSMHNCLTLYCRKCWLSSSCHT